MNDDWTKSLTDEQKAQLWDFIVYTVKEIRTEIANDILTPKKHDFFHQNEIHEKIRNDEDYDDWDYGTEPLYEFKKPE
jgi:hypothetical protein